MSILMSPLDDNQQHLIEELWNVFLGNRRFPIFSWVNDMALRAGYDAAEVINGLPAIRLPGVRGEYRAVWTTDAGPVPNAGSTVSLTMAGLYHVRDDAEQTINGVLGYMRKLKAARVEIRNHLFDVPALTVRLSDAMSGYGLSHLADVVGQIAEAEWLVASVSRYGKDDWIGELRRPDVALSSLEDYLNTITALTTPQQRSVPAYTDPRSLSRAIAFLDVTAELVLGKPLTKKLPVDRTVLFGMDVASHAELYDGISALNQLLTDMDVPGPRGDHVYVRLPVYLSSKLSNIDQASVTDAVALMDALRVIRNSGQHPKPAADLLAAHDRLGLPFRMEPGSAWDTIRAQIDTAVTALTNAILAARP